MTSLLTSLPNYMVQEQRSAGPFVLNLCVFSTKDSAQGQKIKKKEKKKIPLLTGRIQKLEEKLFI